MTNVFPIQNIADRIDITSAHTYCAEAVYELFKNAPPVIRPITTHMLGARGKGARTSLLFTSAMGADGLVPKEVVPAAAAVEIFHMATLAHDDVIDEADTRRGIQSVQSKFSKKEAILCGDFLFGLAFAAIADIYEPYTKFARKFAVSVSKICLGELRQFGNSYNSNIQFYDYIKTIHGKTAVLFHLSAYGGGILGGLPEEQYVALGKFGAYYGIVFQIIDDCKDYILSDCQAQKPTKSDISAGVVNLPLLMAYLKEPALRKSPFTFELIKDVIRLDGVAGALEIARKYEKKAGRVLCSLENGRQAAELSSLMAAPFALLEDHSNAK